MTTPWNDFSTLSSGEHLSREKVRNMRHVWTYVVAAGILCTLTLPVSAHHSFAARWDMNKSVVLMGTVVSVRLTNPHPSMDIEVTEADGTKTRWFVSATTSATALRRAGWTEETVPIGTKIKLEAHPPLKEGAKNVCAGTITMPDGKQFSMGGSLGIAQS